MNVDGGGCSGFKYNLSLEQSKSSINEKEDFIFNYSDQMIVVDKISLEYLEGSTVEYIETMIKSGFFIKENPTAEQSCSCGTSFTPKLDKIEKNRRL